MKGDYSKLFPYLKEEHMNWGVLNKARVIIEKDWLRTENWCRPRRHGDILETAFTPYPKNPILARFFVTAGLADIIGSGVRNLYRYTPIYTDGGKPELIEGDIPKFTNSAALSTIKKPGYGHCRLQL